MAFLKYPAEKPNQKPPLPPLISSFDHH
ncbi:hypothetical protein CCACVL1_30401 [Corchorus capsularis]|uniref:Uncharacterized protein n=1 Tax=Corchorus capsularis TaxID=210143 RepID=A0A1R3FXC9_COCAP|nr:hypothetical protein CCACVL1_30401 [Corchorus capsularis]